VSGGSFAWSTNSEAVLHGVDLEVLEGQLLMVVGEVGCGKSSLLSALLGEMNVKAGSATLSGEPCSSNTVMMVMMLLL
jgi:ABC-type nitrate/sulfonate/bicarbonate transport system ATPase subunit